MNRHIVTNERIAGGMSPQVSIVLPVYNGDDYLAEAIESCLAQTMGDFELIIVDDCSTDDSRAIAVRYAAEDSRIRVVENPENLKLPNTLNTGFAEARGGYWTWIAHDNRFHPAALGKMVRVLDTSPDVGLVYTNFQRFYEDSKVESGYSRGDPDRQILLYNCVGACFLYRASVARETHGYDDQWRIVEDYEYWLRLKMHCRFFYLDEVLYDFRVHGASLTERYAFVQRALTITLQLQYLKSYLEAGLVPDRKTEALVYYKSWRRLQFDRRRRRYLFRALRIYPALVFRPLEKIIQAIKQAFRRR